MIPRLITTTVLTLSSVWATQAVADPPFTFTVPPPLKMGVSGSQTTVVLADPSRLQDPTAPVIIIQMVPTGSGTAKMQTLRLLKDAQRAVAQPDADTIELEPMPLKNGTPVSLTYQLRSTPYAGELYGLAPVETGILFVRMVVHSPEDYRLYAHHLRHILASLDIHP
jgi:hypothetical protein